jgi:nicotinamide-nucleotide amidase
MTSMFDSQVAPRLPRDGRAHVARTTLRIAGRPESYVDDRVRDLYETPGTDTTILASAGTVELLVTARGRDLAEASDRARALSLTMRERLGDDVYGIDDETLARVVGALLISHRATVGIAESCTGGLLGAALTEVPGSSAWFRGGLVCYANELKSSLAGVPEALMSAEGAVSEPVARALAEGARRVCGATFGVAITGIAGPSGGTDTKPVGTVHVALADGDAGRTVKLNWPGDRVLIRRRAVNVALDLLRRRLIG